MARKISILCPTRGRPEGCRQMVESALETADNPDNIEVCIYVDLDDPRLENGYRQWVENWFTNQLIAIFGEPIGVGRSWNRLLKSCSGDLIMMGNDDQRFVTGGWDTKLDDIVGEYPDEIFCAWFEDGIQHGNHCAFPIVSRKWTDTLGFFTPECFRFFCHDTYIWQIGLAIGRCRYIPDVLVRHEHFSAGYEVDDTYKRNRMTTNDDLAVLKSREDEILQHAETLRAVMR